MKRYKVILVGETPLLLHQDNLDWGDMLKKWSTDPTHSKSSVPGDDRTPAWRWMGCLYVEGGKIVVPADNLMTMLREGGKKISTGKGTETFKAVTQSGIVVDQSAWAILINGAEVLYDKIKPLTRVDDFQQHKETVESLGFELFVKRAKIGAAKHVRVRPRFDNWRLAGSLTVFDERITKHVLTTIITTAGAYCGLGDWRPSSPKSPGSFGKFTVQVEELMK
jgi:hypothetical protein